MGPRMFFAARSRYILQLQLEEERARHAESSRQGKMMSEHATELRREREEALAVIEAYRRSTSWRLTSPIRLVGRLLQSSGQNNTTYRR